MSKIQQLNEYGQAKQPTNRDVRQLGVLTGAKYEADSTASQTVINLNFSVAQTAEAKRGFQLFIDGQLLREGASNDFQFTGIVGGVSAQVTLNAPIAAGLNIVAYQIGAYQSMFPNPSSVTAQTNSLSLALDKKGNINRLINGSFDFWQRNTTFAAIANGTYSADRWVYSRTSAAVHTISRDADVPSTAFGLYSLNATVTTADAAVAAGDFVGIAQYIEGNLFRSLKGKNIVMQFWVKSPKVGVHCVSFRNNAQDRSLIKEYTVNVANTWEQKQIRFSHDVAGTWLYDSGIGLRATFVLMSGATFQGAANTWISSQLFSTSSQVNVCDTIGNAFKLADVMIIEDNTATDSLPNFVMAGNSVVDELQLCQRYYEKTYNISVSPGTAAILAGTVVYVAPQSNAAHTSFFKINKRVNPTIVFYSGTTGASGSGRNETSGTDVPMGVNRVSEYDVVAQPSSGIADQQQVTYHFTADAEL